MRTLEIGSVVIIDGIAWTVDAFKGDVLAYARSEEHHKAIWFNRTEVIAMGAGLWALPGRIEPPAAAPAASVVASVAMGNVTMNG
ncbi:MAG: hypothetical protein ACRC1H_09670 [Caldilineaceae bacterium]